MSLADTSRRDDMGWFAYVAGVIHELEAGGTPLSTGLDIALAGDIPDGSGLSSSSSLELGWRLPPTPSGIWAWTRPNSRW